MIGTRLDAIDSSKSTAIQNVKIEHNGTTSIYRGQSAGHGSWGELQKLTKIEKMFLS